MRSNKQPTVHQAIQYAHGRIACVQAQQPVAVNHIGKDTKTKENKEREREREKERNAVLAMKLQLAGGGLP